jgi:uncharacterized membrane protein
MVFLTNDGDLLAWILLIPVITLFGFGINNTDEPIYIVLLTFFLIGGVYSIYKFVNHVKVINEKYYDESDYVYDEEC